MSAVAIGEGPGGGIYAAGKVEVCEHGIWVEFDRDYPCPKCKRPARTAPRVTPSTAALPVVETEP